MNRSLYSRDEEEKYSGRGNSRDQSHGGVKVHDVGDKYCLWPQGL